MQDQTEVTVGGIPPSFYNFAAAVAAQNALNAGQPMDQAVEAARVAKEADEQDKPKEAAPQPVVVDEDAKWREYCLCICHVLHGRFAHLSTERLMQINRLHHGQGIRSFEQWRADEE